MRDRYFPEADAIQKEAEEAYLAADKLLGQFTDSARQAKKKEVLEEIRQNIEPRLEKLRQRIVADRKKAEEQIEQYRFPLNHAPQYETVGEKTQRQSLQLAAIQTAHNLPLYDVGAFSQMYQQGLRQAAFLYLERCTQAEPKANDAASREVWARQTERILKNDTQYAQLARDLADTRTGEERIDRLKVFSRKGSFDPRVFNPDEFMQRNA